MVAHAPAPAADSESRGRRRLRRAALTVFFVVLVASVLAFFAGLLAQIWSLFVAGAVGFVGCALIGDVVAALTAEEPGDDAASRRSRRGLAVAEVLLTFGWVVFALAAWHDRVVVLGLAWAAGIIVITLVFHELRSAHGIVEPEPDTLADAPPPDFSPAQAERFWRDRNARLIWGALMLFDVAAYGGALFGGILLAGETAAGAIGVTVLLLVPVALVSFGLHKWLDIPFGAMPPRIEPDQADVPQQADYRVGFVTAALMPLAVAFLPLMFGAIVIGEGRKGPEPAIGSTGTVLVAAAMAASLVVAVAIFVRARRMRLEVGPHGVRVVNFWISRAVRWDEIERIYAARSAGLTATTAVGSAMGGVDIPDARGLRVALKDGGEVRVGVRNFADPLRDARFQRILVALRREAAAHGVPTQF